jgi:hypothetical protein
MVAALVGVVVFGVANSAGAQSLAQVGPLDPTNGYPMWIEDGNGLQLEICSDEALCAFLRPDVLAPLSFPGNFPEELFYYTADALMPTTGVNTAQMIIALEGAFANGPVVPGDQIMFARLRMRIDGLQPNTTYTVTTPYETTDQDTDGAGLINFTIDRGFGAAPYAGILDAGLGPFLQWDPAVAPAPPAGFIGDIGVEHTVIGSPTGNNFFRIEGPGVGTAGAANLCADATLGPDPVDVTDCIETPNFVITGKLATRFGATIDRATYTRSTAGTQVGVWASSASNMDLRATVDGTTEHALTQDPITGKYFARFAISNAQAVPTSVTLRNYSDIPVSSVTAPLKDLVRITQASFDINSGTLVVRGTSSNTVDTTSMSIGLGAAGTAGGTLDASGTLTVTGLAVPPNEVVLDSTNGGRTVAEVVVTGITEQLLADAGPDITAAAGATVTLNGSNSTGATSFQWTITQVLPAGTAVSLTNANTPIASLTLPSTAVEVTVQLTVSDGLGGTSSDFAVATNVTGALPPTANAGPDQNVDGGVIVQLGGNATGLFDGVLWTQIAGPTVTLVGGPTILNPTFTMPGGANVLTFQLTATGPFGSASDTVTITSTAAATPTLAVTQVSYRTSKQEYRITGTTNVPGPGHTVTVRLGSATGPIIGSAVVDGVGGWEVRERNSSVNPGPANTITITSSLGAQLSGVPLTITN